MIYASFRVLYVFTLSLNGLEKFFLPGNVHYCLEIDKEYVAHISNIWQTIQSWWYERYYYHELYSVSNFITKMLTAYQKKATGSWASLYEIAILGTKWFLRQ